MTQYPLTTSVIVWERKLEIEAAQRKNHRHEPYANYLAPLQPRKIERKPLEPLDFVRALLLHAG